jgi:hypothetical protein
MQDSAVSEPVDWLGLARLGSPDVTPRTPDDERGIQFETEKTPAKETKPSTPVKPSTDTKPSRQVKPSTMDDDDDDEELPFPRAARPKTPPQKTTEVDDWLGGVNKKSGSSSDYLGIGDDVDPDDIFK